MDIESQIDRVAGFLAVESWVVQTFVVVFLTLLINFVQKRIVVRVQGKLEKTRTYWDDALLGALSQPLTALVWIVGLAFAMQIVHRETGAEIFAAIAPLRDVGVISILAWFLVRFVQRAQDNMIAHHEAAGKPYDRTTVDAVAKLLRLSVVITAALVALQTLGFSVSGVLAFGGIGGIAVGFAAKDLLANFFGGLMVYLDRPFEVGDWIRSPDRSIEGTVEHIGWRLTQIRTFDKRPLYIPNAAFTSIAVENPSRMSHRRIYETVGIRYDDARVLAPIIADVEAMLRSHPDIAAEQTLIVNFNQFGPSSLDFFVYTFTKTVDWIRYHAVKQDVLLRILEIVDRHGAEVAFPTSTVHVPDAVRLTREDDTLPLPAGGRAGAS